MPSKTCWHMTLTFWKFTEHKGILLPRAFQNNTYLKRPSLQYFLCSVIKNKVSSYSKHCKSELECTKPLSCLIARLFLCVYHLPNEIILFCSTQQLPNEAILSFDVYPFPTEGILSHSVHHFPHEAILPLGAYHLPSVLKLLHLQLSWIYFSFFIFLLNNEIQILWNYCLIPTSNDLTLIRRYIPFLLTADTFVHLL